MGADWVQVRPLADREGAPSRSTLTRRATKTFQPRGYAEKRPGDGTGMVWWIRADAVEALFANDPALLPGHQGARQAPEAVPVRSDSTDLAAVLDRLGAAQQEIVRLRSEVAEARREADRARAGELAARDELDRARRDLAVVAESAAADARTKAAVYERFIS
jgi:hypothetical protein